MAFPRINLASYWLYAAGGLVMPGSFFVPGGAANNGWTSYAPLSDLAAGDGQTWWLAGMLLIIFSSLLGALTFITTIVQLRAPGMTWFRLPFFVWTELITAFLLLLAFPALQAAAVLQGMEGFYTIQTQADFTAWLAWRSRRVCRAITSDRVAGSDRAFRRSFDKSGFSGVNIRSRSESSWRAPCSTQPAKGNRPARRSLEWPSEEKCFQRGSRATGPATTTRCCFDPRSLLVV